MTGDAPTYYGELVHERVAGPFVVTESLFPAGATLPSHSHASPYFTFTLRGSYRERYEGRSRLCMAGTAVGHPAHVFGVVEIVEIDYWWDVGICAAQAEFAAGAGALQAGSYRDAWDGDVEG